MGRKKGKPQGEFAWIMDGKTEYYGQLVDPLSATKADQEEDQNDSDVELEVRWTHNGMYEWVTLDRVRVETGPLDTRKRVAPATFSPDKATPSKKKTASEKKKRSADEMEPASPKAEDAVAAPKPSKSEQPPVAPKPSKSEQPPSKKQKTTGLFTSLTSKVSETKDALVSGLRDVYKELLGK